MMTQTRRALIVVLATVIIHTTFVMIGHSQHLTKIQGTRAPLPNEPTKAVYLLEEATNRHNQAKAYADAHSDKPHLQVQQVLEWAWLQQATNNLTHLRLDTIVPPGFVKATKAGQQQMEEWLTRAVRQELPTLRIDTREQAQEVNDFSLQVSKLSPHSSEEEERK